MAEMEASPHEEMADPQGMKVFAIERPGLREGFVSFSALCGVQSSPLVFAPNPPRPSEHPPVRGGNMSKRFVLADASVVSTPICTGAVLLSVLVYIPGIFFGGGHVHSVHGSIYIYIYICA